MARDYAKSKKKTSRSKTRKSKSSGGGWRLYFAGVLSGVFLSFIAYLTTINPSPAPHLQTGETEQEETEAPKPRFDFYNMLPEQTIEVDVPEPVVEPAQDLGRAQPTEQYVLQAGSFRQREDADRRRAQLLILGLEPTVQEAQGDTGRWYRVYLGPFSSHSDMNRARGLTAGDGIDTLLLKRGAP